MEIFEQKCKSCIIKNKILKTDISMRTVMINEDFFVQPNLEELKSIDHHSFQVIQNINIILKVEKNGSVGPVQLIINLVSPQRTLFKFLYFCY